MNNVPDPNVDSVELRLVRAAAAGDSDARRRLFEQHRQAAYAVALRITGRNEDALDVVQDAFIRAFERLGEFQHEAGFKTWLLRIASNRALDVLRARKVRLAVRLDGDDDEERSLEPAADADDSAPGRELEAGELRERLQRAIDKLPPEQRTVFAMYATGELTYEQIAEAVGIPIGTVMSRLYHARRRLHEMLADLAPGGAKK